MSAETPDEGRVADAPASLDPAPTDPTALDAQGASRVDLEASRELIAEQARLVRSQIMSERAGFVLKLFTGLVGLLAAVVVGMIVLDAARSERLVLESFSVPLELQERGLTGEVVATRIGDALTAMQADTLASRAPSSYSRASDLDLAVQIPRTGISIGEVREILRSSLGRERKVSGEIIRGAEGYTITARASGAVGRSFTKPEDELDEALRLAAEAVFEMTAPDRFAGYLVRSRRIEEAGELYQKLSIQGSPKERAWALAEWASLKETSEEKLEMAGRARTLVRNQPVAAVTISQTLKDLGRFELAKSEYAFSGALLRGRSAADLAPWWANLYSLQHRAEVRRLVGDFIGAAELNAAAGEPLPDQPPLACRNCSSYAFAMAGRDLALGRDGAAARAMARRGAQILPEAGETFLAYTEFLIAYSDRDWPRALRLWQASENAALMRGLLQQSLGTGELVAIVAEISARNGSLDYAVAVTASSKDDCYPCLRARANIAELQGRADEADRLFALATEIGPTLPQAWLAWGEVKAARGDTPGATEAFRQAARLGPKWADPPKFWGDLLARQGAHTEAASKYRDAIRLAPNWQEASIALETSLEQARAPALRPQPGR